MISISISIALAILLVLLLSISGNEESEEPPGPRAPERFLQGGRGTLSPLELVVRIFSREDRKFILRMRSRQLQLLYRAERRKVALHWVRRSSREVSRIMRVHRLASRQSQSLEVAVEAGLLFQFLRLKVLFVLLLLLVRTLGPDALSELAAYAGELSQRIGRALPEGSLGNNPAMSEDPAIR
jgi:hypothetical protein